MKALISTLEENLIPYALCGGLAMAVHGVHRATVGIDILIPADSLDSAQSTARQLGYIGEAAPMNIRRASKIDPDSRDMLMLDFLLVTDPLLRIWETREEVDWEHGPLCRIARGTDCPQASPKKRPGP